MRVCLLTPEFLPTWGGVGAYTYHLAKELRDRVEVHVLTAGGPSPEEDRLEGVHVHTLPAANDSASEGAHLRFQVGVLRRLPELVREHGLDLVHANHAYMSDLFARRRLNGATSLLTVHTTLDAQATGTQRATAHPHPLERTVLRWRTLLGFVEGFYLRRTPAMIFVSRWIREALRGRYGRVAPVAQVIPNGVDTEHFSPAEDPALERADGRTLLFAGRLLAMKGLRTLLHAVRALPANVRLLLAGPGDPGPWQTLARDLGLEDRCRFLGRVPYAEMPALYRQADAVVLPSFVESCPLVALEAMASGTPLVASRAGGVPEIVEDGRTGWLVPPGDASGLAERIERVLTEGETVRSTTAAARAWVGAHATPERMAAQTLAFYDRALGGEVA